MRFLIDFAKVFVLLLGVAMIAGGGLLGLCGVMGSDARSMLGGLVLAIVGAALFVPINRAFLRAAQARGAKDPVPKEKP